jgi:hypothetical protein
MTGKRDGKVLGVMTSTVSPDGKVMTNREEQADGSENIYIFEKQ